MKWVLSTRARILAIVSFVVALLVAIGGGQKWL